MLYNDTWLMNRSFSVDISKRDFPHKFRPENNRPFQLQSPSELPSKNRTENLKETD